MIRLLDSKALESYAETDRIGKLLELHEDAAEAGFGCQAWLRDNIQKRLVADLVYGDALASQGSAYLDIGSGLTTLQRLIGGSNSLRLAEKMAHDPAGHLASFRALAPQVEVFEGDWFEDNEKGQYDAVFASDLFPNVDQRLSMFLDKYLPMTSRIIMSLTFYNTPRFYETRRTNADEFLYVLAWNGRMLETELKPYEGRLAGFRSGMFSEFNDSIFPNGRQVAVIEMKGDLWR